MHDSGRKPAGDAYRDLPERDPIGAPRPPTKTPGRFPSWFKFMLMSRGISLILSSSGVERALGRWIPEEWWSLLGGRSVFLVVMLVLAHLTLKSEGLRLSAIIRPPKSWKSDALRGVGVGVFIVMGWRGLQALLEGAAGSTSPNSAFADFLLGDDIATLAGVMLMAVILGPLGEEFEFRAYAMESFSNSWGDGTRRRWFYAALGSLAFTLSHSIGHPAYLPLFFLTGLALSWLYLKTRSLAACVTAHATINLLQMAIQLLFAVRT